ncbi:sodium bile acid cotransporter [Echinococcus multilocularis]|uniref:Sodium bile acid cotransporter n=1 Tax=Echinococcus multilocularis TaxID=6211 RepID=A0A068YF34_ECHMU|nr:sodium bile acid cotransporter [Echinococcus multilocularis]
MILLIWVYALFCLTPANVVSTKETIGGLPLDMEYLDVRNTLREHVTANGTAYISTYTDPTGSFAVSISCDPKRLRVFENLGNYSLECGLSYSSNKDISLSFTSDYPVSVGFAIPLVLNFSSSLNQSIQNVTFSLVVSQIGDAYIVGRVTVTDRSHLALGVRMLVLRESGVVDSIFRIGLIILLILATFFMGCEVDINVIRSYAKKPIGPLLGFFCQFIIMPAVAIALAKLTPINPAFGFGLFISGCCPGGGASNVWTRLLGGDLDLSLTMTLFSSLAALGMLPLLLFAFARFFTVIDVSAVPYGPIAANLLYLFVPVTAGLLIRHFRPTWADRLRRGVQPTSCIFLTYVIGFGTFANFSIFRLMGRYPLIIVIGAALPVIGYVAGFLMALLCRRSWPVVVAISIETGVQNVGVGILILISAIPQPQGDLGAVMPIIIAITTPIGLLIALIVRLVVRRRKRRKKQDEEQLEEGSWDSHCSLDTGIEDQKRIAGEFRSSNEENGKF